MVLARRQSLLAHPSSSRVLSDGAETVTLLLLGIGSGFDALPRWVSVLMYRSSGVVNFATGAIGMASSFVFGDLTATRLARLTARSLCWRRGARVVTYVLVMVLPRPART